MKRKSKVKFSSYFLLFIIALAGFVLVFSTFFFKSTQLRSSAKEPAFGFSISSAPEDSWITVTTGHTGEDCIFDEPFAVPFGGTVQWSVPHFAPGTIITLKCHPPTSSYPLETATFTVSASSGPTVMSPTNGMVIQPNTPIKLNWDPITLHPGNPMKYFLYVSLNPTVSCWLTDLSIPIAPNVFTCSVVSRTAQFDDAARSYTLPSQNMKWYNGRKFYWRVSAIPTKSGSQSSSKIGSFVVLLPGPILSSPETGTTVTTQRPVFDWSDVGEAYTKATKYLLQTSADGMTWKNLGTSTTSTLTSPVAFVKGAKIYWRVQAYNDATGYGVPSTTGSFTVSSAAGMTVDVKANGSDGPVTVRPAAFIPENLTISWTSVGATSCTSNNLGHIATNIGLSGKILVNSGAINSSRTYSIICTNAVGGQVSDSVVVNYR